MKIAVVGYGVEGKEVAAYFEKIGASVSVFDQTKQGADYLKDLKGFDMVFRSPGIPYLKKEFDPVRKKLTSLTKYFFEKCPAKIVGVTGTKGKGTTSTLIYEMLKQAHGKKGVNVYLAGNIGNPPLNLLPILKPKDIVVLELSSFQLQDLDKSPHIAVVLGITPDHLDHHKDTKEYYEAKKNIVRFQKAGDFAIFDKDNDVSASFAKATKAKKFFVSLEKSVTEGGFLKLKSLVLKHGKTGMIIGEQGKLGMVGDHNVKNILAASMAAYLLDVPVEVITNVAREFKGLPHRLELVQEVSGVKFYNDSASTNPETAIAALRSFSAPTILVAGGSDKGLDYEALGEEIAKRLNVKSVVLMGQTMPKIEKAIERACVKAVLRHDVPLELISSQTYQEAMVAALLLAEPGDTVLFSPASASFDMFTNYKERGDAFRDFVKNVAAQ